MIYGIGIDLENISNLKKSLDNTGERLVRRLLTSRELKSYKSIKDLTYFFTAKEAFYKAIGTGIMNGFSLLDVEIIFEENYGVFSLNYHGKLKEFMEMHHLQALLDVTCTRDLVLSKVIVYKK